MEREKNHATRVKKKQIEKFNHRRTFRRPDN